MMMCRGDKEKGFHKGAMMKYYYSSDQGNYFACPICGRKAVAPHSKKKIIDWIE